MTPADLDPDVMRALDALKKSGIKVAVGSSSKNTPTILSRLGLCGFFDAVADGNDITRSKPDPEVFLLAAKRLTLEPRECLVVEDALSGVEAGHAGGFKVKKQKIFFQKLLTISYSGAIISYIKYTCS